MALKKEAYWKKKFNFTRDPRVNFQLKNAEKNFFLNGNSCVKMNRKWS
jgi:hypothetical protein